MRLIDADALKAWFFRPYSNEGVYSNTEVEEVIDSQPTIDAIPTEWIEELITALRIEGPAMNIRIVAREGKEDDE